MGRHIVAGGAPEVAVLARKFLIPLFKEYISAPLLSVNNSLIDM